MIRTYRVVWGVTYAQWEVL